jgi:hypothetical protein
MVVDGMLYADARSSKRARRKRLSSGTAGVSEAPARRQSDPIVPG